jgi:lambda family phage tail tape measure protein
VIVAVNVAQIVIEAKDNTQGAFNSVKQSATDLHKNLLHLAEAVGVGIMGEFIKSSMESADKLGKMAQSVGVSTEALSRMSVSARLSDIDMETLAGAMGKLSKNAIDAAAGTGAAKSAFEFLNISVKDSNGHLKSNDQIMSEVADRFSKMEDGAGKTALAMDIFGKTGKALIPMLNGGSAEMNKFADLSDKLGLTLSGPTSQAAQDVNDRFTIMKMANEGLVNHAMQAMLPTFDKISQAMVDSATNTDTLHSKISVLDTALKLIVSSGIIVKSVFETVGTTIGSAAAAIGLALEGDFKAAGNAISTAHQDMVTSVQSDLESIVKLWDDTAPKTADAAEQSGKTSADGYARGIAKGLKKDKLQAQLDEMLKKLTEESFKKQMESVGANAAQILFSQMAIAGATIDQLTAAAPLVERYTASFDAMKGAQAQEESSKIVEKAMAASSEYTAQLQFENSMIGKNALEIQIATENRRVDVALEKELLALKDNAKFKDRDSNPAVNSAYNDAVEGAKKAADATKAGANVELTARSEVTRSWGQGAKNAINTYLDSVTNAATSSQKLFNDAFKGMEDGLVNFVKTGQLNFRSMAESIITDLIRIQVQQNIMKPLAQMMQGGQGAGMMSSVASMFGFADGGIMTSAGPMPLNAYATGGIANSPQVALFGEGRTPEAFVPLPDGKSIPVTMSGGTKAGSGGSVVVNVMISPQTGQVSTQSQGGSGTDTASMTQLANQIGNVIRDVMVQEKRPGGLLAA